MYFKTDPPKRSRIIVGQPIDYGRLNRLVTDLSKKWNRVLTSSQPQREEGSVPLPSKAFSQDHVELAHYSDLMDPVRIQNLVGRRIDQAMFEKV